MHTDEPSPRPEQIGPYRVIQTIGVGGMGVVYEAEQKEPVRRRVAVKMMRPGLDSKEVIGRFESERQALAVMDHPGIARVLDAGTTDQGRPYFVMQLVRGVPLVEYCDRRRLSTRQRVQLFIRVCEAVQHAHQKGVIHRDLKPSNVLVSEDGGQPIPTIIDFGVAKAAGQRLTEQTVVTTYGQAIGTLAYMSPEQAEMAGLDVDTRADVYSLGVMLHELLSGELPLDPKKLGAPVFLARLVDPDETHPTLSRQIASLDGPRVQSIAARRGSESQRFRRELKGDLDWIVQKASDKDRSRRYETANGLAMDLARYLRHDPVVARPPTPTYRLGRFVRRHRAGTLAFSVTLIAIVTGAVAATVGLTRAQTAESAARAEALASAQVADFLVGMFEYGDPQSTNGDTITARQILDRGSEQILTGLETQPLVRARLLHTLAQVRYALSLPGAVDFALEALELREDEVGHNREIAETLTLLGRIHRESGEFQLSRGELDRAVALLKPTDPRSAEMAEALAETGLLEYVQGSLSAAEPMVRRAHDLFVENYGSSHPRVAEQLAVIGAIRFSRGDYAAAAPILEDVLRIEREQGDVRGLSRAINNLGGVYHVQGRLEEARVMYEEALAIDERLFGPNHPRTAVKLSNLGEVSLDLGQLDLAEDYLTTSLQVEEQVSGPSHPNLLFALVTLGRTYMAGGELDSAEEVLRRAVRIAETVDLEHPDASAAFTTYADLLELTGHPEQAVAMRNRTVRR